MKLFCKHIYGHAGTQILGTAQMEEGSIVLGFRYYYADVYAHVFECLKCGKKKVKEQHMKRYDLI